MLQRLLEAGLLCKAKQAHLAVSLTRDNAGEVSAELAGLTGNQKFGKRLDAAGQERAKKIRSARQQVAHLNRRGLHTEAEAKQREVVELKEDHELLNARRENQQLLTYIEYICKLHENSWEGPLLLGQQGDLARAIQEKLGQKMAAAKKPTLQREASFPPESPKSRPRAPVRSETSSFTSLGIYDGPWASKFTASKSPGALNRWKSDQRPDPAWYKVQYNMVHGRPPVPDFQKRSRSSSPESGEALALCDGSASPNRAPGTFNLTGIDVEKIEDGWRFSDDESKKRAMQLAEGYLAKTPNWDQYNNMKVGRYPALEYHRVTEPAKDLYEQDLKAYHKQRIPAWDFAKVPGRPGQEQDDVTAPGKYDVNYRCPLSDGRLGHFALQAVLHADAKRFPGGVRFDTSASKDCVRRRMTLVNDFDRELPRPNPAPRSLEHHDPTDPEACEATLRRMMSYDPNIADRHAASATATVKNFTRPIDRKGKGRKGKGQGKMKDHVAFVNKGRWGKGRWGKGRWNKGQGTDDVAFAFVNKGRKEGQNRSPLPRRRQRRAAVDSSSCPGAGPMEEGSESGSDFFGLAKGVAAEVSKSGVESVFAGRGGVRDLFAPMRVTTPPAEDSEAGSDLLAAARTAADAVSSGVASSAVSAANGRLGDLFASNKANSVRRGRDVEAAPPRRRTEAAGQHQSAPPKSQQPPWAQALEDGAETESGRERNVLPVPVPSPPRLRAQPPQPPDPPPLPNRTFLTDPNEEGDAGSESGELVMARGSECC
eukprot:s3516_g6.t1